jgi:hypothetical protein
MEGCLARMKGIYLVYLWPRFGSDTVRFTELDMAAAAAMMDGSALFPPTSNDTMRFRTTPCDHIRLQSSLALTRPRRSILKADDPSVQPASIPKRFLHERPTESVASRRYNGGGAGVQRRSPLRLDTASVDSLSPIRQLLNDEPAIPLGKVALLQAAPTAFVVGAMETYGGDSAVLAKPPREGYVI